MHGNQGGAHDGDGDIDRDQDRSACRDRPKTLFGLRQAEHNGRDDRHQDDDVEGEGKDREARCVRHLWFLMCSAVVSAQRQTSVGESLNFDVSDIRAAGKSKHCLNYAGAGKVDQDSRKEKPYHHGHLHRAILDAAFRRLEKLGLDAVTIRACAREAGVSPGAPIHHFGSHKGLLSALAERGFVMLVEKLDADRVEKTDRSGGALLVGAYVAFAVSNPKLFDLMWRDDVLDHGHSGLQTARKKSLERLKGLSAAQESGKTAQLAAVRNWSLAHGLASLLINERIVAALGSADHGLMTAEDFVAMAYSEGFVTRD